MNFQGATAFMVVGVMMLIALVLVSCGAVYGRNDLIGIGKDIGLPIMGIVMGYLYSAKENSALKQENQILKIKSGVIK